MLIVLHDSRSVVHNKPLLMGHIVFKDYYLSVLCHFQETICRKRSEIWQEKLEVYTLKIHLLIVRMLLMSNQISINSVAPQTLYSPDNAQYGFFSFLLLKYSFRGHHLSCLI